MRISIFGMGYVGCVSLACLARSGHEPIGVDIDPQKIRQLQNGKPTVVENGLEKLLKEHQSRIRVTLDPLVAVRETEISFICVGTPTATDGGLELSSLHRVAETIAMALQGSTKRHVIAIRSTVSPGTCQMISQIIAETSGKLENIDFEVLSHPEFLREGSAIKDYLEPSSVVIGSHDPESFGVQVIKQIYTDMVPSEHISVVATRTAESIKLINNSWHALKVTFANEVGSFCKSLKIDTNEMIDLFLSDQKLNVSKAYLRPGFAFGGSCLPKDLRALRFHSRSAGLETPLLDSIEQSNSSHIERAGALVKSLNVTSVAILGIAFKAGTDDIRFSPSLRLAQSLVSQGISVRLHDFQVSKSIRDGTTKRFILPRLGELANTLSENLSEVISNVEAVVLVNYDTRYEQLSELISSEQFLIEFGSKLKNIICKRATLV